MGGRILVATRLHTNAASSMPSMASLREFLAHFRGALADHAGLQHGIAVAVGADGPRGGELVAQAQAEVDEANRSAGGPWSPRAVALPVAPWGNFLPGLHALLAHAAGNGYDRILYASLEARIDAADLETLGSVLDAGPGGQLVAGAALAGHAFHVRPGEAVGCRVPLNGITTPWNTLALWDVDKLAHFGFPAVADGLVAAPPAAHRRGGGRADEKIAGGVEEATAIAVAAAHLEDLAGGAWLVKLPSVVWNTRAFEDDAARVAWQRRKMDSKLSRARQQLSALGLARRSGLLCHLDTTAPRWERRMRDEALARAPGGALARAARGTGAGRGDDVFYLFTHAAIVLIVVYLVVLVMRRAAGSRGGHRGARLLSPRSGAQNAA